MSLPPLTPALESHDIAQWLATDDPEALATLWQTADQERRLHLGDQVHFRGLIEISNYCVRQCGYCGLRAGNRSLLRYRMPVDEIVTTAHEAVRFGYGTVVLQAGEDEAHTDTWVADLIQRIKAETNLVVTLSLGERLPHELERWRKAGADRYLLRFETSDPELYARIHPGRPGRPGRPKDRFTLLKTLGELGYEVGSGAMIGIPGQSYAALALDILRFRELDLDMIGVGPFIAHPDTPLGQLCPGHAAAGEPEGAKLDLSQQQVPADEATTYKVIALTRILCPRANMPATTALATLNKANGRELALARGANVLMPNLTPVGYRAHYEIYPNKVCIAESGSDCDACMHRRVTKIGRTAGRGRGSAPGRSER